jgi:hypothetical protein
MHNFHRKPFGEEILDTDTIMLKWILKKQSVRRGLAASVSGRGTLVGSNEDDSEQQGFIKGGEMYATISF